MITIQFDELYTSWMIGDSVIDEEEVKRTSENTGTCDRSHIEMITFRNFSYIYFSDGTCTRTTNLVRIVQRSDEDG